MILPFFGFGYRITESVVTLIHENIYAWLEDRHNRITHVFHG